MYPPLGGSPFALSTIPDAALLAVGHYDYDRYQPKSSDILSAPAESTWCTEPPDPSSLLSELLQCSREAQPSLLSEPGGRSPVTVDGSADLSPPGPKFKSHPPSPAGSSVRSRTSTPFRLEIILKLARIDGVKRCTVWDHILERRPSPPKSCKSPLLFSPHICSPAVKLISHISDRCFSFQEQNEGPRPSIDIRVWSQRPCRCSFTPNSWDASCTPSPPNASRRHTGPIQDRSGELMLHYSI